ncbi:hypothetical protein OQA88_173 [Cercophora sp. LCS_1]
MSQPSKKVAFLGPVASYSHQATKRAFPDDEWALVPTTTIKDVFVSVQTHQTEYGVVPFENSTHGTVTFTLDGLADRTNTLSDIVVVGEVYLDVHHFLLGNLPEGVTPGGEEEKGVPLVDLGHVKRVYSHPQAFGQTAGWFARYLKGVETVEVSSTSKAAELARQDATGESAAVAGELAGSVLGLETLARWVEDREDNTTRFFVIRRRDAAPGGYGGGRDGTGEKGEEYAGRYKSLVSFTVKHTTPGALADVLDCFRRGGLNLTSINSLPSLEAPFRYLFFAEFEGSQGDDPEGRVKRVFEELAATVERWRALGSWVNQRR